MPFEGKVSYYCDICKCNRTLNIDQSVHEQNVKKSPNSLVTYTDIHRCLNNKLCAKNLKVDLENRVRGIEELQFPSEKKESGSFPPLPSATSSKEYKEIVITRLSNDYFVEIIFIMKPVKTRLNIGGVTSVIAQLLERLESEEGNYEVYVFGSNLPNYGNLIEWIKLFINTLEKQKKLDFSTCLEGLRYIFNNNLKIPNKEDENILNLIFSSNRMYMKHINHGNIKGMFVSRKGPFSMGELSTIIQITDLLVQHPDKPIFQLVTIDPDHYGAVVRILEILVEQGLIELEVRDE